MDDCIVSYRMLSMSQISSPFTITLWVSEMWREGGKASCGAEERILALCLWAHPLPVDLNAIYMLQVICWLTFHLQSWIVLLWNHISISQLDISTWMPNWHLKLTIAKSRLLIPPLPKFTPLLPNFPMSVMATVPQLLKPTVPIPLFASHFNPNHQQDLLTVLLNMYCFCCYNSVSLASCFVPYSQSFTQHPELSF